MTVKLDSVTVRTRIEPSPSGSIHVGNARTALFNWLYARHHRGAFVLRISDTDVKRVTDEHYRAVLEDMLWLGLEWDEGPEVGGPHAPYRQSERFDIYREYANKLVEKGFAYYDHATPEDIEAERKRAQAEGRRPDYRGIAERRASSPDPSSIRFIVPEDRTLTFRDEILGEIVTDLGRTPDFVILRSDGSPTYMLAVTVDDHEMGISHVIRGQDLVASTPRQILLREAMGVKELPVFAHLPLLVDDRGRPLSKRWGDVSVRAYRDQGYLPEAMVNYMALLGWSYDDRTNLFTVEELIDRFSIERIGKNPAAFDVDKLEWVNMHHIKQRAAESLAQELVRFCVRASLPADSPRGREVLERVAPLLTERMKRLDEAPAMIAFLFSEQVPDEGAGKALEGMSEYLSAAADALEGVEKWTAADIEEALRALAEARELKPRKAFQPIRAAVTGRLVSPPLFESLEILGREQTLIRLRKAA